MPLKVPCKKKPPKGAKCFTGIKQVKLPKIVCIEHEKSSL